MLPVPGDAELFGYELGFAKILKPRRFCSTVKIIAGTDGITMLSIPGDAELFGYELGFAKILKPEDLFQQLG